MNQVPVGVLVVMMCGVTQVVAAQEGPRVTAERRGEDRALSLSSGDLTVIQTIRSDGVLLRLHARGDVVSLAADQAGNVSISRGKRTRSFSVRTGSAREQAAVRALLAGSAAWRRFDALIRSAQGGSSRLLAFRPAHSMIWLLHGDYRPLLSVATPASTVRLVRHDCDSAYARRLDEIYNELVSCLDTWNPLQTAWCAYEYNFKLVWAGWTYAECLI